MKKLIFAVITGFLLAGCALKESDTKSERILKHTANSPVYIVVGAGAIAHEGSKLILTGILVPPYAAYKYLTKDANNTEFPKVNLEFSEE